jgi:hypothetical protein
MRLVCDAIAGEGVRRRALTCQWDARQHHAALLRPPRTWICSHADPPPDLLSFSQHPDATKVPSRSRDVDATAVR